MTDDDDWDWPTPVQEEVDEDAVPEGHHRVGRKLVSIGMTPEKKIMAGRIMSNLFSHSSKDNDRESSPR